MITAEPINENSILVNVEESIIMTRDEASKFQEEYSVLVSKYTNIQK